MDFEQVFLNRRSVRAYEDRPIPDGVRERVLSAALRAPTAGNLMLYSILEVEDPSLKARLAETCDHQTFIARAPWVLVFLADYARLYGYFCHADVSRWCAERNASMLRPREADLLLAVCDALIAAQTAAIAAEALGLGTCYIGDIMENGETQRELLGLPRYVFPITMLCLGYPTEQQRLRSQPPRLPRDLVVQKNRYQTLSDADFGRMYTGAGYGGAPSTDRSSNAAQELYARKFAA